MHHKFKVPLYFEDVNGHLRAIRGCPLNKLPELSKLLSMIMDRTTESKYETISEIFENDLFYRTLVKEILSLVGLEIDWISSAMLSELIYPRKIDEQILPSLIASVCLPQGSNDKDAEPMSLDQYRITTLVNAINLGLINNLIDAIKLGETVTAEEIEAAIEVNRKARSDAEPIAKKAETIVEKQRALDLVEELNKNPELLFSKPPGKAEAKTRLLIP